MMLWGALLGGAWAAGTALLDRKHDKLELESMLGDRAERLPYPLRRCLRFTMALCWPLWATLALCTALGVLVFDAAADQLRARKAAA